MTTDITELAQSLKAAAEKATPGEWVLQLCDEIYATNDGVDYEQVAIATLDARDADYIALANPANVRALVEALEKAHAKATQQGNIAALCLTRLPSCAAMLQAGNSPQSMKCKTADELLACVPRNTGRSREHFISLCNEFWNWSEMDLVCADDRGYELRMEWDGKVFKHPVTQALWRMYQAAPGNSPVIPDGYVMVPMRLTAENGAKAALLGEFNLEYSLTCHECFGEGCDDCSGEGTWTNTIPIDWTTIKKIWAKGVEHFAAARRR
ncbi:ead/Ea22-like family protein [Raoultella scottii]|uniref:ead/Ea22-like family protein n=1 Tax=Raoultella scottii TaxID=3040937 RepID=UPI002FA893DA